MSAKQPVAKGWGVGSEFLTGVRGAQAAEAPPSTFLPTPSSLVLSTHPHPRVLYLLFPLLGVPLSQLTACWFLPKSNVTPGKSSQAPACPALCLAGLFYFLHGTIIIRHVLAVVCEFIYCLPPW